MARYFTRPRAATVFAPGQDWDWCEQPDFGSPSRVGGFEVDDFAPTDTGLLDSNGDCVMRAPNPIGFGRDDEW